MSTRRLILAALVCGLAIVLAGGVKLFQIATDDGKVTLLAMGEEATLGDMTVSVVSVTPGEGRTVVEVSMSGVDGADALEGWRMLAGGEVSAPVSGPWDGLDTPTCTTVGAGSERCSVVFPASEGTVNVAYLRAGVQSQWSTAA
ncbi:MAG: hypothetical protein ACO36A_06235 [Ilumatobacteraceae bacterium]